MSSSSDKTKDAVRSVFLFFPCCSTSSTSRSIRSGEEWHVSSYSIDQRTKPASSSSRSAGDRGTEKRFPTTDFSVPSVNLEREREREKEVSSGNDSVFTDLMLNREEMLIHRRHRYFHSIPLTSTLMIFESVEASLGREKERKGHRYVISRRD